MNAPAESLTGSARRPIAGDTIDRRLVRAALATLVIGGYMALGYAFGLSAEAYLLLGIPIMVAFQVLVVRRPIRALWLRQTPPMTFTARTALRDPLRFGQSFGNPPSCAT